jgi:uncharacterized protein
MSYGAPQYGQQPQYGPQPQYGRQPQQQLGWPSACPQGARVAPAAPRQPKARNPLAAVLLGLVALAVLAIAGFVAVTLLQPGASASGYQNDQYEPPPPAASPDPIPQPATPAEADDLTKHNRLYEQQVPVPVRCDNPTIDVSAANDAELKAHFEGLMGCLMRVWNPPVTDAGWTLVRPTVTIYGKSITTQCGNMGVNAFYCGLDQQVYYSNQFHRVVGEFTQNRFAVDAVMAHEFGHVVQGRTGILWSTVVQRQQAGDKMAVLQISRRLELQADCFSGTFLRSVSRSLGLQQSDVAFLLNTFASGGDDGGSNDPNDFGDHGRSASRRYWGTTGLSTSALSSCNTFTAEPALVR